MAIGKSKKQILMIEKEFDGTFGAIPMTNVVDANPAAVGADIDVVCTKMGAKRNYNDLYHTTVNFNVETNLTGTVEVYDNAGTLETYSNLDSLFLICGLKRDVSIVDQVIYTPDSNASSILDLKLYKEDVLRVITGASASMTLSGVVGEPLKLAYNLSAYTDLEPTSEVAPDGGCEMANLAIIDKMTGVTVDGGAINMNSFTMNQNVELQDTYATGVAQYDVTDFDPQLEVSALRVKNNSAHWTAFKNGSLSEIIITAITTNGKTIELKIPFGKLMTLEDGDDAGRQIINRTYRCQNSLGDDNFSIKILPTV